VKIYKIYKSFKLLYDSSLFTRHICKLFWWWSVETEQIPAYKDDNHCLKTDSENAKRNAKFCMSAWKKKSPSALSQPHLVQYKWGGSAVIGAHLLESQWYYNNYIWLVPWLPCSCYIVTTEIAATNCIAESDNSGPSGDNFQSSWFKFSHPWMLFMVRQRFQRWQETGSGKRKLARCPSDEKTSHVHTQNNAKLDWRESNLSRHRSLNGSWRIIIRCSPEWLPWKDVYFSNDPNGIFCQLLRRSYCEKQ